MNRHIAVPGLLLGLVALAALALASSPTASPLAAMHPSSASGPLTGPPPPCTPLNFAAGRLADSVAPTSMRNDDAVVKSFYRSGDSRNFTIELSSAQMQALGLGGGRTFGAGGRLKLVISHGDFDPATDGAFNASQGLHDPGAAAGLRAHADLIVEIIDAQTGAWYGEGMLAVGCHRE